MNTDRHAMVWCRNFEGGRSYTTTLGHSWQFMLEPWYQQMLLSAIEWTAGETYANCVTFSEVADLIDAAADAGDLDADGEAGSRRCSRRAARSSTPSSTSPRRPRSACWRRCRRRGGERRGARQLVAKAEELVAWAKGLR